MPPMPFPMPLLFITAVKDVCATKTFEKLLNILFSEVYCWYFGFTTFLFYETTTDMSLHEVLNLFLRWPLVFRYFLHPRLVAHDVVTPLFSLPQLTLAKMTVHAKSNQNRKLITLARANKTPQLQATRMLVLMTVFFLFLSPTMACKGTLLSTYVCDLNPVYVSVYLHQLRYDILWYFPFVLHELPCDV